STMSAGPYRKPTGLLRTEKCASSSIRYKKGMIVKDRTVSNRMVQSPQCCACLFTPCINFKTSKILKTKNMEIRDKIMSYLHLINILIQNSINNWSDIWELYLF